MSSHLKELSKSQLKQYIADHRKEDELFSQALSELMSRESNPTIYPTNLSNSEIEKIFTEKIRQSQ